VRLPRRYAPRNDSYYKLLRARGEAISVFNSSLEFALKTNFWHSLRTCAPHKNNQILAGRFDFLLSLKSLFLINKFMNNALLNQFFILIKIVIWKKFGEAPEM